ASACGESDGVIVPPRHRARAGRVPIRDPRKKSWLNLVAARSATVLRGSRDVARRWAGATAAAHLDRRKRSGTMSPGAGARHGWGTHAHRAAALAPDVGGDVCFARLCLLAFSGRGRHTAVDRLIDGVRPDHFGNGAA